MATTNVQRTQLTDEATQRHTEKLRQQGNEIADNALVQGNLQTVSLPDTETVTVNHGLSRPANGFLLAGLEGATSAGYILTISKNASVIRLQANGYGATVTAAIWVF